MFATAQVAYAHLIMKKFTEHVFTNLRKAYLDPKTFEVIA
jgi:hypothetical protein